MALAYTHIKVFFDYRMANLLPQNAPSIMEFGEQNWYGDVPWDQIIAIAKEIGLSADEVAKVEGKLKAIVDQAESNPWYLFDIAKLFYKVILDYSKYSSIDLHGPDESKKFDLNQHLSLNEQFDFVTNLGTSEHVFNQLMFFENMHNVTKPGGTMMHSLPNQGCYDHGFYNYHPTFIFDLALANQYTIQTIVLSDNTVSPPTFSVFTDRESYIRLAVDKQLSEYSGLTFILKKPEAEKPFVTPQQGYYDNQLSPEVARAWAELPK